MKKILGEAIVDDMESLAKSTADWMGSVEGTTTIEQFSIVMGILGAAIKFTAESTGSLLRVFTKLADETTNFTATNDVPQWFKDFSGSVPTAEELKKQNQAIIDRTKIFEKQAQANPNGGNDVEANRRRLQQEQQALRQAGQGPLAFSDRHGLAQEAITSFRAMDEEARHRAYSLVPVAAAPPALLAVPRLSASPVPADVPPAPGSAT